MVQYKHQFRLLYRLLDESGLEWLSDEVRLFSVAPAYNEVPEEKVAAMRNLSSQDIRVGPQLDTAPEFRSSLVTEPKSFEECIQYLFKRIENLTTYLEFSVNLSKELGIGDLQLGLEANAQVDLTETIHQMRTTSSMIREMMEIAHDQ